MIKTLNLVKKYESKNEMILKNLNLEIKDGSFTSIMGPSGSGKTTLLLCLSGLLDITSGDVIINAQSISKYTDAMLADLRKNEIGFVFQNSRLMENLTVSENILLALRISGKKADPLNALRMVSMEEYANYYPKELSGGMAQKVCIARSLVNDPKILFADEPTGALDSNSAKMIMDLLKKINQEYHKTIVMVTHQKENAMYGDRILSLKDGEIINDEKI